MAERSREEEWIYILRHGQSVEIYDTSDARSFGPLEEDAGTEPG